MLVRKAEEKLLALNDATEKLDRALVKQGDHRALSRALHGHFTTGEFDCLPK